MVGPCKVALCSTSYNSEYTSLQSQEGHFLCKLKVNFKNIQLLGTESVVKTPVVIYCVIVCYCKCINIYSIHPEKSF